MTLTEQIAREEAITGALVAMAEALGALPDDTARAEAMRRLQAASAGGGSTVPARGETGYSYGGLTAAIRADIAANPGTTPPKVADRLGVRSEMVRSILHRLKSRGEARQMGGEWYSV